MAPCLCPFTSHLGEGVSAWQALRTQQPHKTCRLTLPSRLGLPAQIQGLQQVAVTHHAPGFLLQLLLPCLLVHNCDATACLWLCCVRLGSIGLTTSTPCRGTWWQSTRVTHTVSCPRCRHGLSSEPCGICHILTVSCLTLCGFPAIGKWQRHHPCLLAALARTVSPRC